MGLDTVELVMEIEEAFDIFIPDDRASRMLTVGDVYDFILEQTADASLKGNACLTAATFYELRRQLRSPPIEHRPYEGEFKQKYGENLAWWSGPSSTETSARKAVSQWLPEKTAFDKLNQQKTYVVGEERGKTDANGKPIVVSHYTQIVWKDTKKIGAARWTFKSKDRTVVVIVCNYDPTGNYTGQKPY